MSYSWASAISSWRRLSDHASVPTGSGSSRWCRSACSAAALLLQLLEALAHHRGDHALAVDRRVEHRGPCRRMVLSVPENVGASLMMASPMSTKALNASDSACPEPFETIRFSGVDLEPLEERVLVADHLAQPAIALGLAVVQRLSALLLHHPRGGVDEAVVRDTWPGRDSRRRTRRARSAAGREGGGGASQPMRARVESSSSKPVTGLVVMKGSIRHLAPSSNTEQGAPGPRLKARRARDSIAVEGGLQCPSSSSG